MVKKGNLHEMGNYVLRHSLSGQNVKDDIVRGSASRGICPGVNVRSPMHNIMVNVNTMSPKDPVLHC